MNYVILKGDGSSLTQNLEYYIQQGNSGDEIFVGWVGALSTDVAVAVCTLPNLTTNTVAGVYGSLEVTVDGTTTTYNGWTFTLTTDQTTYNGMLTLAVRIVRNNNIVVSYPIALVINETGVMPDTDSGVTIEELNSYLLQLESLKDTFVTLATTQTISGVKTFTGSIHFNSMFGDSIYGDDELYLTSGGEEAYITLTNGNEGVEIYGDSLAKIGSANGNISIWDDGTIDIDGLEIYILTDTYISGRVTFNLGYFYGANNQQLYLPTESGTLATRSYVDNVVTTLKANAFIKVNTTTYPSLADFLTSTGVEGNIYLYPIDTSDLTAGYYQYIWENSEWLSLGTTKIDLSDYVEKTTTIAGLDLEDNITSAELLTALGLSFTDETITEVD